VDGRQETLEELFFRLTETPQPAEAPPDERTTPEQRDDRLTPNPP
jgi:hypothetical protein